MLPTDLNFFSSNYCSDPFFSRSNFLMNEETEEFIDESLELKSSEGIDIGNDQEMTVEQKHAYLCELILNKKFKEAVNFHKKDITSSFSEKLFEQKILNYISESNLTHENIKEIFAEFQTVLSEKTGMGVTYGENSFSVYSFLYSHSSSPKTPSDEQLKVLQISLAKNLQILKADEQKEIKSKELESRALRVTLSTLAIMTAASRGYHNSGFLTLSLPILPIFKTPKHLLGATAGVIAYTAGADATTACALGISTSLLAHHVPMIASLFQQVVIRVNPIAETGINGICVVVESLIKPVDLAMKKLDNGIMWLDRQRIFDNRATQFVLNTINTAGQTVAPKINNWLFK